MNLETIWCPLSGARVGTITDMEGAVTRVICQDYHAEARTCARRASAMEGGPLAQFLDRVDQQTLADATTRCVIVRR
jgi:hypothetical protein